MPKSYWEETMHIRTITQQFPPFSLVVSCTIMSGYFFLELKMPLKTMHCRQHSYACFHNFLHVKKILAQQSTQVSSMCFCNFYWNCKFYRYSFLPQCTLGHEQLWDGRLLISPHKHQHLLSIFEISLSIRISFLSQNLAETISLSHPVLSAQRSIAIQILQR